MSTNATKITSEIYEKSFRAYRIKLFPLDQKIILKVYFCSIALVILNAAKFLP